MYFANKGSLEHFIEECIITKECSKNNEIERLSKWIIEKEEIFSSILARKGNDGVKEVWENKRDRKSYKRLR